MGFKPPNFSGLNHPVSQNKSQCCRERSHLLRGEHRQTQLPAPNPKPFQCLVPFPLPHGGRTSDPQNRPAEQLQPQPWKDSRSLGLICLPALKLIPCTLCLTAPYLACQRSGEAASMPTARAIPGPVFRILHAIQSRWWMSVYLQDTGFCPQRKNEGHNRHFCLAAKKFPFGF